MGTPTERLLMTVHNVYATNAFEGDYGQHHPARYGLFLAGNESETPDLVTESYEAVKLATISFNNRCAGARPMTKIHLDDRHDCEPEPEQRMHFMDVPAGPSEPWRIGAACHADGATILISVGNSKVVTFLDVSNKLDGRPPHQGGWSLADAHLESLEYAIQAERKAIENGER
jgi:hypothetical protein